MFWEWEIDVEKKKISYLQGMDMDAYTAALNAQSKDFLQVQQIFASKALSVRPGQSAIITNGGVSNMWK